MADMLVEDDGDADFPFECPFLLDNADLLGSWLYPKDITAASSFLEQRLKSFSKVVIYGAGTHSQMLWENFSKNTRDKIVCVLDQFPEGREFPVQVRYPQEFLDSGDTYDCIVLSHFDFESSMLHTLKSNGVPNNKILPIYINSDYFCSLPPADDIPWISSGDRTGKQVVVFVTLRDNRKIVNDAVINELSRDSSYILINLDMARSKVVNYGLYNSYYYCQRSLVRLFQALESLRPDLVYIHDQIETLYFLPRLLMNCMPGIPVIWEPYDLLHLMIDDYSLLGRDKGLSDNEIAFTRENEQYALLNSAGVVYKETGPLAEQVYHHGRQRPSLHFNQYLGRNLICDNDKALIKPYRLVYAGTIDTAGEDHVFTGDNYLLDDFSDLLSQGFMLDIFLNCDDKEIAALYGEYKMLESNFTSFRLHPRQPLKSLIPRLAKEFHFGIQIGRCDSRMLSVNSRRYRSTFSAKLWTYLFAGLPVIVDEELEGMAEFVRNHDVGLAVSCSGHNALFKLLEGISNERYEELKLNVGRLAYNSRAEKQTEILSDFIINILTYP